MNIRCMVAGAKLVVLLCLLCLAARLPPQVAALAFAPRVQSHWWLEEAPHLGWEELSGWVRLGNGASWALWWQATKVPAGWVLAEEEGTDVVSVFGSSEAQEVEMEVEVEQEEQALEADPFSADGSLCAPAQSKRTWTCHKCFCFTVIYRKKCHTLLRPPRLNTGPFTLTVRTRVATLFGEKL